MAATFLLGFAATALSLRWSSRYFGRIALGIVVTATVLDRLFDGYFSVFGEVVLILRLLHVIGAAVARRRLSVADAAGHRSRWNRWWRLYRVLEWPRYTALDAFSDQVRRLRQADRFDEATLALTAALVGTATRNDIRLFAANELEADDVTVPLALSTLADTATDVEHRDALGSLASVDPHQALRWVREHWPAVQSWQPGQWHAWFLASVGAVEAVGALASRLGLGALGTYWQAIASQRAGDGDRARELLLTLASAPDLGAFELRPNVERLLARPLHPVELDADDAMTVSMLIERIELIKPISISPRRVWGRFPIATAALAAGCVAGYCVQLALGNPSSTANHIRAGGFVFGDGRVHGAIWRLFTAPFVGGSMRELGPTLVLVVATGVAAERLVGPRYMLMTWIAANAIGYVITAAILVSDSGVLVGPLHATSAMIGVVGTCVNAMRRRNEPMMVDSRRWVPITIAATLEGYLLVYSWSFFAPVLLPGLALGLVAGAIAETRIARQAPA